MSMARKFLNEEQDPTIVEKVHAKTSELLTEGEEIIYIAVQKKPVVAMSPDCVVLTNKRFIIYRPKLMGRVDFEDHIWRDLQDARLKEGMLGATITMVAQGGRSLSVDYLPKAQARRLYSFAQQMEENAREERRARELEDKRAAAGGIVLQEGRPSGSQTQGTAVPDEDPLQRLKQLKEMMDAELITQSEYESKKADILSKM